MMSQEARVAETLRTPDVVVQSPSDFDVRLYHRLYIDSPVGEKHMCAVVKWLPDDAFLITAHFTDKPKRGIVLWTNR